MAGVICPRCGSRNTIVKNKGDFSDADLNVPDSNSGTIMSASNNGDLLKYGLSILFKVVSWLIDNNTKKIYCKSC